MLMQPAELSQLTAVQLVASIFALSFARAVEVTGDAGPVSALILIRTTRDVLTQRRHLVIAAGTICFAIAYPAPMDARNAVFALILCRDAGRFTLDDCCAILLGERNKSIITHLCCCFC